MWFLKEFLEFSPTFAPFSIFIWWEKKLQWSFLCTMVFQNLLVYFSLVFQSNILITIFWKIERFFSKEFLKSLTYICTFLWVSVEKFTFAFFNDFLTFLGGSISVGFFFWMMFEEFLKDVFGGFLWRIVFEGCLWRIHLHLLIIFIIIVERALANSSGGAACPRGTRG